MLDLPCNQEVVWVSDRQNFWNTDTIGEQTYMVASHGIDISYFEEKKVLFLVHGYNNTVEDAAQSYHFLAGKMGASYDLVVNYFWPGYQKMDQYFQAEKNAENPLLTQRLAGTLQNLAGKAAFVDVVAHSMGNRVMLEALSHSTSETPLVRYFYSFAAAVDDDSVDEGGVYSHGLQLCKSIYVFHSDVDVALNGYETLKQRSALGSDTEVNINSAPANVQFIDCTRLLEGNHSGYFTSHADPLFVFIGTQQKEGSVSSTPKEWELLQDGSLKEGDVVLNWSQKCKALMVAAAARVAG